MALYTGFSAPMESWKQPYEAAKQERLLNGRASHLKLQAQVQTYTIPPFINVEEDAPIDMPYTCSEAPCHRPAVSRRRVEFKLIFQPSWMYAMCFYFFFFSIIAA